MSWVDLAVSLAKQFEGCRLQAYPDPAHGWLVPTIGYGATGYGITKQTVWTQEQADSDLSNRMNAIGSRIDEICTVALTDEQKGALCDFAYNEGLGNLQHSTLLELVNAGNPFAAANEFDKWDLAGGEVLPGLVKRRDAEKALFLLGS
ncbi:lysozyme [Paraburkholderia sp. HD33-4]|uniref:lysozyme n=1 Tax=Paraburkholderia sp. HD33-4 TaxID=2883242 RepID=UPI001F185F68|nr:lysozyme [Paraburkholderia sp. HD33-4]